MVLFCLFKDIFEILRVLAIWRHQINPKSGHNWPSYSPKHKIRQNWFWQIFQKLLNFIYCTAKANFDDFYVLVCSSATFQPILDFWCLQRAKTLRISKMSSERPNKAMQRLCGLPKPVHEVSFHPLYLRNFLMSRFFMY